MIHVKRIHEPAVAGDGSRYLVDRLWPRGVSKDRAALAAWLKPLSPGDGLRKAYHGETAGSDGAWDDFRRAYAAELDAGGSDVAEALATLDAALAAGGPVTLLYAARNPARNNAVALREWLLARAQ